MSIARLAGNWMTLRQSDEVNWIGTSIFNKESDGTAGLAPDQTWAAYANGQVQTANTPDILLQSTNSKALYCHTNVMTEYSLKL